ncbi:citramalate synthase [Aliidongia dinghuensis]|uniref:Citramalate synthase n=1 Tax=Aliidongia dinghuensis TaxID=1867774 RepID=A0A8J2YQG1_9PROT|nr:citramalate synthase [Aliidongia dinghuensis]GGF07019.1 citramalate synthase [Aliidongia dinghuensis]
MKRIHLYDTTLRDGAQTRGVDFSGADKRALALLLDRLGVDTIEAGWPGANPADTALYADLPRLRHARFAAFGMTRKAGLKAAEDPGLAAVLAAGTPAVCLVGKTWDFHVTSALGASLTEAIDMISESVGHAVEQGREVVFDAEHLFDGWKANAPFARDCLRAAADAGARWLVLCDTNGGTLPHEVDRIVGTMADLLGGDRIGIHAHDDTGNAVANSLAAVHAGARMVQGTLNGLGERCGNANLISLIPTLTLKLGYETGVTAEAMAELTQLSRQVDDRLNRLPDPRAPYVGAAAFAHKGGLHVSAVAKDARSYEHVAPELVGNERHIVVSDQAGRATLMLRLAELHLPLAADDPKLADLLALVKGREAAGFAYDGAGASFELLVRRALDAGAPATYFRLAGFRVVDERRRAADGSIETLSEAQVELEVGGRPVMVVAQGNGPVDALDAALRRALEPVYPSLAGLKLTDYKVRILTPEAGTKAITRVLIESRCPSGERWSTVGVGSNVIDASYQALEDALVYRLMTRGATVERAVA